MKPVNGEPEFQKAVNSAFIETGVEIAMSAKTVSDLVMIGLTLEHCISTSVRMAANLGFQVTLISDATAAFDKIGVDGKRYAAELIHQTELANLKDEFAFIQNTSTFLSELDN